MFIPELAELPDHVGPIDVALLPTNGLRIRAQFEMQVVMDHRQAAQLFVDAVAELDPSLTVRVTEPGTRVEL